MPSEIDLIVDAQDLPRAVSHEQLRAHFPVSASSRTFAVVAGSFPAQITSLNPDIYEHRLDRGEWSTWKEEVAGANGDRVPVYGDYATQAATYAPSPGFPGSPSIRYTTADGYVVIRGRRGRVQDGIDYSQYIGHARYLRDRPYFAVPTLTLGDEYVLRIATEGNGSGNATTWRIASLQRHLELVANDMQAFVPMIAAHGSPL
jgi:hypothetical protein